MYCYMLTMYKGNISEQCWDETHKGNEKIVEGQKGIRNVWYKV